MTNEDFLRLLNTVAKLVKPFHDELKPIDSMEMDLKDSGMDSLDGLMTGVYLCEIFDVEDEISKAFPYGKPVEMFEFLKEHGRRQVTLEEALKELK
jgi:acyl carrier protein